MAVDGGSSPDENGAVLYGDTIGADRVLYGIGSETEDGMVYARHMVGYYARPLSQ
jgi:hypothetical protein